MIKPSIKSLVTAAATLTACTTILAFARPFVQSDAPPLAGQTRVQQLAQNFQQMQTTQQKLNERLDDSDRRSDLVELQVWTNELMRAQDDVRKNPSMSATRYLAEVKDRVNQVRARLRLPLLDH